MKATLIVFLLCVSIAFAARTEEENRSLFKQFQTKFNKVYPDASTEAHRYQVFKAGLEHIDYLNSLESDAEFGITQFADLTREEFKQKHLSQYKPVVDPNWPIMGVNPTTAAVSSLPETFDWRDQQAVTPVKNQGDCGSCWSFSTTGNVESQWFLAGHTLTGLSEQNLVDCSHNCMEYEGQKSCNEGCNGGLQPNAYNYIIANNGIDTESSYPYLGVDSKCNFEASNVGATISNWTMVSQNETEMAVVLVNHGPLAIAADAIEWQYYTGGVFDLPCGKNLDHGILIVGYGNKDTILGRKDYWIVKNSWGESWGEQGYIYLVKGRGECGCNTFVSTSIIN